MRQVEHYRHKTLLFCKTLIFAYCVFGIAYAGELDSSASKAELAASISDVVLKSYSENTRRDNEGRMRNLRNMDEKLFVENENDIRTIFSEWGESISLFAKGRTSSELMKEFSEQEIRALSAFLKERTNPEIWTEAFKTRFSSSLKIANNATKDEAARLTVSVLLPRLSALGYPFDSKTKEPKPPI